MNCPTCGQELPDNTNLLIDMVGNTVTYRGRVMKLTRQQADILWLLNKAGATGMTYDQILNELNGQDPNVPTSRTTLKTQKCFITKRLAGSGLEIMTSQGRGYRLVMG